MTSFQYPANVTIVMTTVDGAKVENGRHVTEVNDLSVLRAKYNSTNGLDVGYSCLPGEGARVTSPSVKVTCPSGVELRPDRNRSRSKLNSTKRLSNLSAAEVNRSSDSDLERFFTDMGCSDLHLDRNGGPGGQGGGALLDAGHGFSTVSLNSLGGASLDSTARARSLSSHESLGGDSGLLLLHHHSHHQQQQQVVARQHSVDALDDVGSRVKREEVGGVSTDTVERNARIFRWLCNVKPADSKDQVT